MFPISQPYRIMIMKVNLKMSEQAFETGTILEYFVVFGMVLHLQWILGRK